MAAAAGMWRWKMPDTTIEYLYTFFPITCLLRAQCEQLRVANVQNLNRVESYEGESKCGSTKMRGKH